MFTRTVQAGGGGSDEIICTRLKKTVNDSTTLYASIMGKETSIVDDIINGSTYGRIFDKTYTVDGHTIRFLGTGTNDNYYYLYFDGVQHKVFINNSTTIDYIFNSTLVFKNGELFL